MFLRAVTNPGEQIAHGYGGSSVKLKAGGSLTGVTSITKAFGALALTPPPSSIATTVTVFGENRAPAITGETPLPNVTGPLLDACGNVVAYSMAHDIQTMETTPVNTSAPATARKTSRKRFTWGAR